MAVGNLEWRKQNLNPAYLLRPALWFTPDTLPVVGIDALAAQDILFALRAADHADQFVADSWLRAVQCAQLAHDRLLADLREVDRNLTFWQRQVSAGGVWSHGAFMLLSRGPLSFAEDVTGATRGLVTRRLVPLLAPLVSHLHSMTARPPGPSSRAGQQPAAAGSGGTAGTGTGSVVDGPTPAASAVGDAANSSASATDMMQQRVLLLRGLRLRLARALAELTEAAGHLRVGDLLAAVTPGELPSTSAAAASFAAAGSAPMGFAAAAAEVAQGRLPSFAGRSRQLERELAALQAVEDAVFSAVRGMLAALRGLLAFAGDPRDDTSLASPEAVTGSGATEPALSLELQQLLELLRLQPPAALALGLPLKAHVAPGEPQPGGPAPPSATAGGMKNAAMREAHQRQEAAGPSGQGSADRPMGLQVLSEGCSAAAALGAARRAAALAGPLVPLPATARMPSRFQRHWLRYCAIGALALYGGVFLVRHSRLVGSDDLDRWVLTAASAVRSALRTHVAEPLAAVRDELFRTFRDRPAIASPQDFSLSRESLMRMLADFAADHQKYGPAGGGGGGPVATAAGSSTSTSTTSSSVTSVTALTSGGQQLPAAGGGDGGGESDGIFGGDSDAVEEDAGLAAGMAILMRSYEDELRHPLRNLVLGDLARALLIQVQRVKVDGEAAMLRLDQILRANELSLSLMAAMPALGISLVVAVGVARLVVPRAPDRKRAAVPSRLAMASLEVALSQLATTEEQHQQQQREAVASGSGGAPSDAPATSVAAAASAAAVEELRGLVVYRLCRVYEEVTALYGTADRTSRFSEWRQLYDDLLRLAAPAPPRERLATHQRMMRTYTVFQR